MQSTAPVRTLQIVVAALLLGVLLFAGVVWFARAQQPPEPKEFGTNPLDWVALLLVPMQLAVSFILPRMIWSAHVNRLAADASITAEVLPEKLTQAYTIATIIGGALAEGAAFLVLALLMMGGHRWFWSLVALAITAIALRFPRVTQVTAAVTDQTRIILDERQLSTGAR